MHTLSIRHSLTPDGSQLVAVDYNPGNRATGFSQPVPFTFELTESDRSRLRFYMEEVLKYPDAETRDVARRIEADMERWGEEMFRQLFQTDLKAYERYVKAAGSLSDLRIEIQAEHPRAWAIPWEIMRDSNLGWLAVQAQSFVRLHANPRRDFDASGVSTEVEEAVRILYVVCRPDRSTDVPFQAIGRPLLQAFHEHREQVQIDVLRPPTFEALGRVLRDAMDQGRPYHVLHFDGHGVFTDLPPERFEGRVDPRFFRYDEGAVRGYLLFEDPTRQRNCRLVTGDELGELLVRTQTPWVVLNACQSAMARLETPQADPETASSSPLPEGQVLDQHGQDRAYGSLAHEIMAHGVGGVVAMQWSVYVQTAAEFVGGSTHGLPTA